MALVAYNNVSIPAFMYGTAWKKNDTARLVQLAVESGFKAIDTANQLIHYHEKQVGDALLELRRKGIQRESLFLQTKFTSVDGQGDTTPYDASAKLAVQVKQSMDSSLLHLNTDHVDSYVLHGPHSGRGLGEKDWEVWMAIEHLHKEGKCKMVGVSNFSAEQLDLLCKNASNKPMVVQNRCYAAHGWDKEVRDICRAHNIIYQGFSLLTANPKVLGDSHVRAIAKRLGTGVEQVVFRFAMQIGMLPLTGTTNAQHMKEDLQAEHLTLTPEEVKHIETVGVAARH